MPLLSSTPEYYTLPAFTEAHIDARERETIESMLQVARLRDWKQQAIRDRTLSVMELVRRATTIEAVIDLRSGPITSGHEDNSNVPILDFYDAVALVQLSMIVAGPRGKVPEVSSRVRQAVRRLTALSYGPFFEHIVVPICAAGYLAFDGERAMLSATLSRHIMQGRSKKRMQIIVDTLQRCWDASDGNATLEPDWLQFMADNSLVAWQR